MIYFGSYYGQVLRRQRLYSDFYNYMAVTGIPLSRKQLKQLLFPIIISYLNLQRPIE